MGTPALSQNFFLVKFWAMEDLLFLAEKSDLWNLHNLDLQQDEECRQCDEVFGPIVSIRNKEGLGDSPAIVPEN